MQPFPLIEAFWASIDKERPSGDDPKRVAFALHSFYSDLKQHAKSHREARWKTPLFKKLEPVFLESLEQLLTLSKDLGESWPELSSVALESLRSQDKRLRETTFQFEKEEKDYGLPVIESPKLAQFNYLFEGWKRGYSKPEPLKRYAVEYLASIKATQKELAQAKKRVSPRESEEEKDAVEAAISAVDSLASRLQDFVQNLASGPQACDSSVAELLVVGSTLGQIFQTLERCAPLADPCPFCGGQISLSGRCRQCSRRLPHLEETELTEGEAQSEFLSVNCRAVDQALLKWESDPQNEELWKAFQQAVRAFAGHVTKGGRELENLSTNPERPVDRESSLRQQETVLAEVGSAFQAALTTLSKYSQSNRPPTKKLDPAWRAPLLEAELKLQELQTALTPEPEENPSE